MGDTAAARVTTHHYGWSRDHEPCLVVAPGTTVEFELRDVSDGQLGPESTLDDLVGVDWERVWPLGGPVYVEGAEAGDALQVTVLGVAPGSWGWTANIPGFGLLADEFPEPALHLWRIDPANPDSAAFSPGVNVPLKPFLGQMGLAPGAEGRHDPTNPRHVGGNLDIRDLGVGSRLSLPVEVPGALFSCGDAHAAQGDGEVCGTAIEVAATATLRFDLLKRADMRWPRLWTPGPVTRHLDEAGYEITTGVGPDLMEASRTAVREMIAMLVATHDLSPMNAYLLCSVCADLRISEIVDEPDWVVSMYFPSRVFT